MDIGGGGGGGGGGWSISYLFSIPDRSFCRPGCQIGAHCLVLLSEEYELANDISLDEHSDLFVFD